MRIYSIFIVADNLAGHCWALSADEAPLAVWLRLIFLMMALGTPADVTRVRPSACDRCERGRQPSRTIRTRFCTQFVFRSRSKDGQQGNGQTMTKYDL